MNSMSGQKLKGIPYTGTLPAVITGTKTGYLHGYKIYGNLTQNGTPTPSDPIVPSECGERTTNLLNFADLIAAPEGIIENITFPHLLEITLKPNTTYTMYSNGYGYEYGDADTNRSMYFNGINNSDCVYVNHPSSKTTDSTGKLAIGFMSQRTNGQQYINNTAQVWIVEGSTPLPYEPYGYKLPLLSGSTPVDIYLGESQTTRRIGKIDLSELPWVVIASPGLWRTTSIPNIKYTSVNTELGDGIAEKYVMHIGSGMSTALNCIAIDTAQVSVNTGSNSIKPTGMFYYALATPETAVVNEPLRKIGNYADTIDSTRTSAQIPTSANSTTISWGGQGLAPSQFDSVQEWVTIPTYKRVNGEWVEDNSN